MVEKKKILIVKDEPDFQEVLIIRVENAGYEPLVAKDGELGLAMAKSEQPDLIILDLILPVMDGFDFCRRVKSDPELKNIPIFVLSALSDIESQKKVDKCCGTNKYFVKPFDLEIFMEEVHQCIN